MRTTDRIAPEDYEEPRCPLTTPKNDKSAHIVRIPTDRVIERLDQYLYSRNTAAAERHLLYWLSEAEAGGDTHGRITVTNELMGLYRNTERRENAYKYAGEGLKLIEDGGYEGRLVSATTYINAATVYKTFGESDKAYPLYLRAKDIYERELDPSDERLGGLYNNMALALADLGMYDDACGLYRRAIEIMKNTARGGIEAAISYLNMANAYEGKLGLEAAAEEIESCLAKAEELLDADKNRRDGYYAYVCDRCAPTYRYYGYFAYADELGERSRSIYEGA